MIIDKFKLAGKVAIVTGSSRGIGKSLAIGLAEAGADIALVATKDSDSTAQEINKLKRQSLQIKADLNSTTSLDMIVDETLQKFGRIDILVNNAGTIRRSPVTDFTEEDWDDVINVNQKSLFFLSQKVARVFIKQGQGGKIINIASMLSYQGGILVSSYTASKSAVMGITRIMANELAQYNINVNAIAPGYIATDNTAPLRSDPERNQAIVDRIPAGRWGDPDDLKGTVVFLASDASLYMNGFTLAIDGGWLAR